MRWPHRIEGSWWDTGRSLEVLAVIGPIQLLSDKIRFSWWSFAFMFIALRTSTVQRTDVSDTSTTLERERFSANDSSDTSATFTTSILFRLSG